MRALDWLRRLQESARAHNKRVFTPTELAHLSGSTPQVLAVAVHRLCKQGVLTRLARGLYGIAAVAPEDLLPYLDPCAYITGAPALFRHGHVTQQPRLFTCFTNRRHSSRRRVTTSGTFEFITVSEPIYAFPGSALAPPEQALLDHVYRCRLEGVGARGVTLRRLNELRSDVLETLAERYPGTVRQYVAAIMSGRPSQWDVPRSRAKPRRGRPRRAELRARGGR